MAYESTSLPSGFSNNENPLNTQNWKLPEMPSWNPFGSSSFAMQYGTQMNPENSAQGATRASAEQQESQSSLGSEGDFEKAIKAFTDFKKLYSRGGTDGLPLPGSSDVRMHYGASGQVYYTAGMSPEEREKERQRAEPPHVSSGIAPFTPNAPKSWETPEAKKAQSDLAQRRQDSVNAVKKRQEQQKSAESSQQQTGMTQGIGSFFAKQASDQASQMKTSPQEAEEPGMTAKESAKSAAESLNKQDKVVVGKYGYVTAGKESGTLNQGAKDFLQQKSNEARAKADEEERKKKKKG